MNMTVDFENCFKFEGNGENFNITKQGVEVFVVWNNNDSPEKKKFFSQYEMSNDY